MPPPIILTPFMRKRAIRNHSAIIFGQSHHTVSFPASIPTPTSSLCLNSLIGLSAALVNICFPSLAHILIPDCKLGIVVCARDHEIVNKKPIPYFDYATINIKHIPYFPLPTEQIGAGLFQKQQESIISSPSTMGNGNAPDWKLCHFKSYMCSRWRHVIWWWYVHP